MTKTRAALLVFLFVSFGSAAQAQIADDFHIFPQFVDGSFPDGAYYKATLMILPLFDSSPTACTFNLYGMTAAFSGTGVQSVFTINIPAGGFILEQTLATQNLAFGYATLTCNDPVYAQVLYALYNSVGVKAGEATIFSANQAPTHSFLFDQREAAGVGVAIANDTDSTHTYTLTATGTFGTRTGTVFVPARRNAAFFINEVVANMPANAIGKLVVRATDSSTSSVIAFRITGLVFTTIPAN
jgi:hypothetical protein